MSANDEKGALVGGERAFSQYTDIEEEVFDTTLEENIKFTGTITFSKPFKICGKVTGQINATSDLVIDEGAVMKGDIRADKVLIKGNVEGNINASSFVYVASTGSLLGDVEAKSVVLEPGSKFSGRCTMTK